MNKQIEYYFRTGPVTISPESDESETGLWESETLTSEPKKLSSLSTDASATSFEDIRTGIVVLPLPGYIK